MERHEVLQQKLEHWCAASVRALANQRNVLFRGHHLVVDNQPYLLQAPYCQLDFSTHDAAKLRGVADSIAQRLIHSDRHLHDSLLPAPIVEKIVFEVLEQLRCEALLPNNLPGIRTNLKTRFLYWAFEAASSPLVENSVGLLLFTVNVVAWSRLHSHSIPEQLEELIEGTRWGFTDPLKQHLYALRKCTDDQAEYAEHALAVANEVHHMIEEAQGEQRDESGLAGSIKQIANRHHASIQWLDVDSSTLEQNYGVSRPEDIKSVTATSTYTVFNNTYDQVVEAGKSIRAGQLAKLRQTLDKRIAKQSVNTHRVARYLKKVVASPQLSGWQFAQEEGYLDSARLARLITSPNDHRLFKYEQQQPASDCVVTLLVDNSGSMNHHNDVVAAMIDNLTKAMELADITTEVLGFTTTDWNGGKVLKEWQKAGKPANPGRLTSTCHTIYKAAETPWRRSRSAIAGMLKTDQFREGVDGEALLWALDRIEARREKHKIILMVSDGSPMDTATHAANEDRYLDQHLSYVAHRIEQRPDVHLCAIGVGLDLSVYYRESMSISLNNELGTADFIAMADLLTRAV